MTFKTRIKGNNYWLFKFKNKKHCIFGVITLN